MSLAGQIARACAVFCVDEIVVFDDGQAPTLPPERNGYTGYTDPNYFLYHILSYLETPAHLRKALFPIHADLHLAGTLHSLDMPHHMKADEWCPYREAVAAGQDVNSDGISGTWVNCGLPNDVFVPVSLEDGTRVTVKLHRRPKSSGDVLEAEAVSPDAPRQEAGYYWGYSVRQASSLSAVFTECQHEGGYDVSLGTSERGRPASSALTPKDEYYVQPHWNHLLMVLGGVAGLEAAFSADHELRAAGVPEAQELFDRWINLVPQQGSRTIRTEEAVWIGLTCLRPLIEARNNAT